MSRHEGSSDQINLLVHRSIPYNSCSSLNRTFYENNALILVIYNRSAKSLAIRSAAFSSLIVYLVEGSPRLLTPSNDKNRDLAISTLRAVTTAVLISLIGTELDFPAAGEVDVEFFLTDFFLSFSRSFDLSRFALKPIRVTKFILKSYLHY